MPGGAAGGGGVMGIIGAPNASGPTPPTPYGVPTPWGPTRRGEPPRPGYPTPLTIDEFQYGPTPPGWRPPTWVPTPPPTNPYPTWRMPPTISPIPPTPPPTLPWNYPTRKPTRAPTKPPTMPPPPTKSLPPTRRLPPTRTRPTPPPSLPTPPPTPRPTAPTTPAPTRDDVKVAMCRGVSILGHKRIDSFRDVFTMCPSKRAIQYYVENGLTSTDFEIESLDKRLKQWDSSTGLATGMREFMAQLWAEYPIDEIEHFSMRTPFEASSYFFDSDMTPHDARNALVHGGNPRVEQYRQMALGGYKSDRLSGYKKTYDQYGWEQDDLVTSVATKSLVSPHYRLQWKENAAKGHLTFDFVRRAKNLQGNDASIDTFLFDFGTHYRKCGVFGGAVGADYYFHGYGSDVQKAQAMARVYNSDLRKCFRGGIEVNKPDFAGFSEDEVQCYGWDLGGNLNKLQLGIKAWQDSVGQEPALLTECLGSITELLELLNVDGLILSRMADRIDQAATDYLRLNFGCYFFNCPDGQICMGKKCIDKPQPLRWPTAVGFCLPKPVSEVCPSSYEEFHDPTWVFWDTENGERGQKVYNGDDLITTGSMQRIKAPAELGNGGIKAYFCCHKEPESNAIKWPKGTYCILAHNYVSVRSDPAWSFISVVWNDEDDNNQNDHYRPERFMPKEFSRIPLGTYDNYSSYTEQTFLCRDDGPHDVPIVLPRTYPFYLVRHQDRCQEVAGMGWTHVEVTWDTENDHQSKERVRFNHLAKIPRTCNDVCEINCKLPDASVDDFCYVGYDKIALSYCYYEPVITPGPTPSPTPSPIPPTPSPISPTPPPTYPPPTNKPTRPPTFPPTPRPTRPTPSPTYPTPPPTLFPTLFPTLAPTPPPTHKPTPFPTSPTPNPTPFPTPFPTPSPTPACYFCSRMEKGVNIVGLTSIWPQDKQPSDVIFRRVQCECEFCTDCKVIENCDASFKFYMGDNAVLGRFWEENPVGLEAEDMVFEHVSRYWNHEIPEMDLESMADVRDKTRISLVNARNALLFGGNERMITYGKTYSILERHLGKTPVDQVYTSSHVVLRSRKLKLVTARWQTRNNGTEIMKPTYDHLAFDFIGGAKNIFNSEADDSREEADKEHILEKFIEKYGTHYVAIGVFGGMYGADFYFTGYGTKPEMKAALLDTVTEPLPEIFEYNRQKDFDRELSGKSFIRRPGGKVFVGPDVKGWIVGGNPYGIRTSGGHRLWKRSLVQQYRVAELLNHKLLISISQLLELVGTQEGKSEEAIEQVSAKFKFTVVYLAHYWLMSHYWCFFLDNACENKRFHPFLREADIETGCPKEQNPPGSMRRRVEMEVCIGQEKPTSGFALYSRERSRRNQPAEWCKGRDNMGKPSDIGPFQKVHRKGNCAVVPPAPRWPNSISYCLPKPVGSLECPKEQYPEYEWTWEWEKEFQRSNNAKLKDKNAIEDRVTRNNRLADPVNNVNPVGLTYSVYPWSYWSMDLTPRHEPWKNWLKFKHEELKETDLRRTNRLRNTHVDERSVTFDDIAAWIARTDKMINDTYTDHVQPHYANWLKTYDGSDLSTHRQIPLWCIYEKHQSLFIPYNGWVFWDTEDDEWNYNDESSKIDGKRGKTPTHMTVAQIFELDMNWAGRSSENRNGGLMNYHKGGDRYPYMSMWADTNPDDFRTGGVRMDYCCTVKPKDLDMKDQLLSWPNSHLCIYAHGVIDSTEYKFHTGTIGWDCENGQPHQPKIYGNKVYLDPDQEDGFLKAVPTGRYHIEFNGRSDQFIMQNVLCQRKNPHLEQEIVLPRDVSFYLMQHLGSCQFVSGMHITDVELRWATEVNHKTEWEQTTNFDSLFTELEMNTWGRETAYGHRDRLPNGHFDQDFISIKYCFYQPTVVHTRSPNDFFADGMTGITMGYEGTYEKLNTDKVNPEDAYCA